MFQKRAIRVNGLHDYELVSRIGRFTKPGGWVEFMDFTMTFYTLNGDFKPGCMVDLWTRELKAFLVSFGLEPEPGPKLRRWVTDAGFQKIHEKRMALPVGMWPKENAW